MGSDLKIEIFAYDLFHTSWLETGLITRKYDVTEIYKDECLSVNDTEEVCDELFYDAVMCRRILFQQIYEEEMDKMEDRYRNSLTGFSEYIKSTCDRCDWFGFLTVFERMLATCAFVLHLCYLHSDNENIDIMKFGHICWAMYFDAFTEEFYGQGGWSKLRNVAASYGIPCTFLRNFMTDSSYVLFEVTEAIVNYNNLKQTSIIHEYKTVSMLWVKSCINDLHESSINLIEFAGYENCIQVEYILSELKRLCSPCATEVLEYDQECSERQVFISDSFYLPLTPKSSQESIDGKNSSSVDSDGNGENALPASFSEEGEIASEFENDDSNFEDCSYLYELQDANCRIHNGEVYSSLDISAESIEFESICIISDSERDQNLSRSMAKMQLNYDTLKLEETSISEIDFSSFTNDRCSVEDQVSDTTDKTLASLEMTSNQCLTLEDSLVDVELDSKNTSVNVSDLSAAEGESSQNKDLIEDEFACVTNFSNISWSYDNRKSISISEWDEKDLAKNISTPIKKQS